MEIMAHPYWQPLFDSFDSLRNPEKAKWGKAYMRDQYDMFGLTAPVRAEVFRLFIKENGFPENDKLYDIIKNAWELSEREMQYAAMELLFRMRKNTELQIIELYEWLITHKSWWDTVDYISPNLVGNLFINFPQLRDKTVQKWMNSENFWLQRCCLLFQLKYKAKTDTILLFDLCSRLANEKEFFIRKAIGWSLREYAKTNPEAVQSFVDTTTLSGLSKREALKHITKE
jgi:3-methyladenine DNA glycosylase AlkD